MSIGFSEAIDKYCCENGYQLVKKSFLDSLPDFSGRLANTDHFGEREKEFLVLGGYVLIERGLIRRNDEIIRMCKNGGITQYKIGEIFNISGNRVRQIYTKYRKENERVSL